ncbi:MAG: alanine--tRNA ligase, partial [candidate division KSB1 bacterium]|nr:alanine--tRNA ligase [candidate division KSB1 bacterium]
HIMQFGKKDNFWEMGDTGPCGPCSEIHIDRGEGFCDVKTPGHVCGVNSGCARFIELWNLVFIQYNRDESGKLQPLPAKHVDTGAGFERLLSVMQGKRSNYDTDLFQPILTRISEITGKTYGDGEEAVAFRVIADHLRALSFAVADGAIPGNEGRGYVLRRILRRAARFGRLLDMHEPFIYRLLDSLIMVMGDAYPELAARKEHIQRVIRAEEESFGRTLDRGIELFEQKAAELKAVGATVFPGWDAFVLHDTYGFPLDLTQLMAAEKGMTVDVAGFQAEMEKQRDRSAKAREARYHSLAVDDSAEATEFVGYERDSAEAQVVLYEEDKLVLDCTPFYAESGGQVGDVGIIRGNEFEFQVEDTRRIGEHVVHIGRVTAGRPPRAGDRVTAAIDVERRRAAERNHTVTHLLHKALKQVLGDHIQQAGSLVHPDYMRFDFTHFERLGDAVYKVEELVNEKIRQNLPVQWSFLPLEEAKARGAVALFGEKYGEVVRMVEVQGYSRELCGGTHVRATGEIGLFVITGESSVAAGVRRVECLTGHRAFEYLRRRSLLLEQAAQTLGCREEELSDRLVAMQEEYRVLETQLKQFKRLDAKQVIAGLLQKRRQVGGVTLVAEKISAESVDELREMGDLLREQLGSGVGVLAAEIQDKAAFVCVVSKDWIERGLKAGEIVKRVASAAGGGGGGAPHMATAGAKDVAKIQEALTSSEQVIKELVR